MQNYCVYRHIRPDKNEVFYVGMGIPSRPASKHQRTDFWRKVVAKNNGNYKIDLLFEDLTRAEASEKEIEFIALYGRQYDNSGTLVNFSLGGDCRPKYKLTLEQRNRAIKNLNRKGCKKVSEATRLKMSLSRKGKKHIITKPVSEERKRKQKEFMLGNSNTKDHIRITDGQQLKAIHNSKEIPEGWWRGEPRRKRLSEETRKKMSESKKGKPMPFTTEQRKSWTKGNAGSKGNYWINNGESTLYIKCSEPVPDGWKKGRIRTWKNQFEK